MFVISNRSLEPSEDQTTLRETKGLYATGQTHSCEFL